MSLRIKFYQKNPHKFSETLMNPMSGQAKLIINKKNDRKTAKYKCLVEFDEIGFGINNEQFSNFFTNLERFEMYMRAQKVFLLSQI